MLMSTKRCAVTPSLTKRGVRKAGVLYYEDMLADLQRDQLARIMAPESLA